MALRLDKYLTELGAGTRSEVKKQIKAGLVTVNGAVAKKPEQKVDETGDEVCLRGERLLYTAFEYYLFHKPAGCVSATQDNMHRTVMDYLSDTARGDLLPVGRLDLDTEGLLLITNDGALAHALLSPSRHVAKTYTPGCRAWWMRPMSTFLKTGLTSGRRSPVSYTHLRAHET